MLRKDLLRKNKELKQMKKLLMETNFSINVEENRWSCGEYFGTFEYLSKIDVIIYWDDESKIPHPQYKDYVEELVYLSV